MEAFVSQPIKKMESERIGDNDGLSDSIELPQTSNPESPMADSTPTEWTNEKHSLYLKSMEASFVNQLYNSSDYLGWRSQEHCSSDSKYTRKMHGSARNSSGQFKVFQDGCWETVNMRRNQSKMSKANGSRVLSGNQWIRHFRSGSKQQVVTSTDVQAEAAFATNSNRFTVSHSRLIRQDSFESNTEMTDQNFVDEDVESEKATSKRMKTSGVTSSSNDQVVPFGKFGGPEDNAANCVFQKD